MNPTTTQDTKPVGAVEPEPPAGVSWENWIAALALRPAQIAPGAWETACRAGAERERMKETLAHRRRDALGRACYLAGADECSSRWEELPGSLREAYRTIACDTYAVSALTWSPALQNIVIEYTRDSDLYRAVEQAPPTPTVAKGPRRESPIRVDFGSPIDALRSMAGSRA